jgi:putative (di)nucleoside polyphosphate hydrolase
MSGRGLYRPCVGVLLLNAQGLAFIGRRRAKGAHDRTRPPYLWQMPQGGIDEGETPYEAALRELYEETNVSSVALLAEASDWLCYDLPKDSNNRWSGRFIGQTQRWFALRFTGQEDEIDIHAPGGGVHKPEFDAWRWEKLTTLPELIVPFKRTVYEQVVKEFAPLAEAQA